VTHLPEHMNTVSTDHLTELVQPSLRHLGLDLVDLQWRPGRTSLLRLVIDSGAGVTLDDCERVSHAVGAVLDAYDPIAGRYALEVSSPGAERPVRTEAEWRAAVGRRVNVRVRSGDAELIVEGRLLHLDDTGVEIEARDRNRRRRTAVARGDVIAARIVVDI
jgi:ribosome maturation factor RimP